MVNLSKVFYVIKCYNLIVVYDHQFNVLHDHDHVFKNQNYFDFLYKINLI